MLSKSNITLVVIVMSLALGGLIGIQVYWIRNAVETEQEQLQYHVNLALTNVVRKLDREDYARNIFSHNVVQEVVEDMHNKVTRESHFVERNIQVIDSVIYQNGEQVTVRIVEGISKDSAKGIFTEARVMRENTPFDSVRLSSGSNDVQEKVFDLKFVPGEVLAQRINVVSDILVRVFDEEMYLPVEKRVDVERIDSMIETELVDAGVNPDYSFSIADQDGNNYAFKDYSVKRYSESLKDAGFRHNLFPDDFAEMAGSTNYLLLDLHHKGSYLLKRIWLVLLLSIIFLAFITYAFYYTVSTILKQKKLSAIKNDFINNMTHELKTPISTISLACEALADPDLRKDGQVNGNYINMIKEENVRLGVLVERVLQSAVIEKGELKVKKDLVDFQELITRVADKFRLQVDRRGGSLTVDFNATEHRIYGDKMHLTNMLYNLLDNAIKYSPEKLEIHVETSSQNDQLVLTISDKGIGIHTDHQKKIFDKLFRVPTGNVHDVKGFGLGLSYVKAIVETHNGTISVQSEPGKGSRFSIVLPTHISYETN